MTRTPAMLEDKYKIVQINEKGEMEFTIEQIQQIKKLAARVDLDFIADLFEISRSTFYRIRKRQPAVEAAYNAGVADAVGAVADKLLSKALAGDRVSIIFYLKTKGGWSEKKQVEHLGLEGASMYEKRTALKDMSNEDAGKLLKDWMDHDPNQD